MLTCPACQKEWPENYCPECARTIDRAQLEEDLDAGGEVIRGTWASCAAKVKLNPFRYLWMKQEARLVFTVWLALIVMIAGSLVVEMWLLAASAACLFAMVSYLLWMITHRTAEIYANAALTAGLVVSRLPLEFISLANMDTGAGDEVYAIKRVAIDRLPCHPHSVGTEFPCVSGFHAGPEEERWGDFDPQPLSFGTGDTLVIQARANKLGAAAFTQLREAFTKGTYPRKAGELLWLADAGLTQPPPLPRQPPPLPTR